jgi:hypothetical protein
MFVSVSRFSFMFFFCLAYRHSNNTVCLAALIVVCQISTIRLGAEMIVGIGAVPSLVALLDHNDTEVLRLACDTISHITLQPDLLQALIDADACGRLVALLLTCGFTFILLTNLIQTHRH